MRTALRGALIGAAMFFVAAPAVAHHAMFAEFSTQKPVTLTGVVTKLEWTNPHGWIHIDVQGANGQVEKWEVETGSPARMEKRGLKRTYFRIGGPVVIGGYAARDGDRKAAGTIVTFPERDAANQEASFALGR